MRIIPNLNITQEEYINLLNQAITRGGEGIICPGSKKDTLFKLFIDLCHNPYKMTDNKEKKITALYQMNLDELVKPLRTISYNGTIIGYEMSYDQFDKSLKNTSLSRKELIKALQDTKEVLLRLKEKEITYGDVTEDNVLYNQKTGKIKLCDIDNIQIQSFPIDVKGFSLNKYYSKTGTIDEKADAYMHNILTIKSLSYDYDTYDTEILLDLKREIYPTKFKLPARKIFKSMTEPESFNGEYVIQYIKR